MRGVLIYSLMATSMIVPVCRGQSLADQVSFKSMSLGGIHLYGVSVFSAYSTSAYPGGLGLVPTAGAGSLGADVNYGASGSLGWQYHRQRTNFSLLYSGSYGGMVRYSDTNAFNHSLSVGIDRTLSPKWTFSVSAFGSLTPCGSLILAFRAKFRF